MAILNDLQKIIDVDGFKTLKEVTNPSLIAAFIEDVYTKNKDRHESNDLEIRKIDGGWVLKNNSKILLFRNIKGQLFFNTQKYSVFINKIQKQIKDLIGGIDYTEVDEYGMRKEIYTSDSTD